MLKQAVCRVFLMTELILHLKTLSLTPSQVEQVGTVNVDVSSDRRINQEEEITV